MNCIKCRLRRWYYTLLKYVMFPVRTLAGGINITDQVTATLIKDGKVIKRIVGLKMHNKWKDGGLDAVALCLQLGCSAAPGLKGEYMRLGSQCSDVNWTYIATTEQGTSNTHPATKQVKFTANWPATPAIADICQALLILRSYTGSGNIDASLYNFGTQFTKVSGVSLKLEWTTTLTTS